MKREISDVFFDLDHTLWDFDKNSGLAFAQLFAELEIEINLDDFLELYLPINQQYWELYRKDMISHQELRYGRFKETFDRLGVFVTDEIVHEVSEKYISCLPLHNHLFEGAVEILEYLKPKYRLHIITNGFNEVQQRKLANSGILPYFETVTNSETAGVKKPNPAIFQIALSSAKAQKESSLMIGDCIDADVRGALDSGLDAIFFCQDLSRNYKGIKKINHLYDLRNHL